MTVSALGGIDSIVLYFQEQGIDVRRSATRTFPGETIYVIEVRESDYRDAVQISSQISDLEDGTFIAVRKIVNQDLDKNKNSIEDINDTSITHLIELLNARSRTSEQQPSLRYVRDVTENLNVVMSRRHHLVFGRRGVGKTALLLEAKKLLEQKGALTFWIDIQPMRQLDSRRAFLQVITRLCGLPLSIHGNRRGGMLSAQRASIIREKADEMFYSSDITDIQVARLVPELQYMLKIFGEEIQQDIFLFMDDIHYLSMKETPSFLDMVHGITRDNNVRIKAAGIKHQTRWFVDTPPTGLQTGHDASLIDLDVTLEDPGKARSFLWKIFQTYVDELNVGNISKFMIAKAIDRLVLASGGVPRDFLILGASAIQIARARMGSSTGVQDVNEAAGNAAKLKIQELEEDAASSLGTAVRRIAALSSLRQFLLEEEQFTFFRVDFRDKEQNTQRYDLLQSLMDLRLIHLLNSSLSDAHEAGKRSEVYMIDLSQYSGSRFKRNLTVINLERRMLVMRKTGTADTPRMGRVSRDITSILRRAPLFPLLRLELDQ